jgi:hypothetical protein
MTNRICTTVCVCIAISGLSLAAEKTGPWQKLLPFKKIEADPEKSYAVSESNGPWMILATVFRGENAEAEARRLVYELRKRYKLEAYSHAKVFDYTHEVRGRGFRPDGTPKVMKHANDDAVKEVAVLVGNFSSVDDDHATEALKKIKSIEPESLMPAGQSTSGQVFAEFRKALNSKKKKGPMGNAFVATNPLLPPEYFNSAGVDKLVLEMNKEVPHSLLDCPGKYTLKVATFSGSSLIDQRKIRDVSNGKKMNYSLQEAAEHAHLLTEALRKQGYDAYEFHDRQQSIVTVGSFDMVSVPGPNGQPVANPQIQQRMRTFAAQVGSNPGSPVMEIPKSEIERRKQQFPTAWKLLDLQPTVIQVPKRAVGAAYLR